MRPPRICGFDYRGSYAYSLTFCTFRRRRYFEDASVVSIVLREIVRTAIESAFDVLAYCFMPDHLHLLVQSHSPDADLLAFVKRCRQRTTVAVNRPDGALLWQRGYHERTLRSEERVETVAKYIEANPVRAGLVRTIDEWPHTGGTLLRWGNRVRPD
jgi:REP-associated tyrosine transposase